MIFNLSGYIKAVERPENRSCTRSLERGFHVFSAIAADRSFQLTNSKTPSLVELGIGGGGSLLEWQDYFTGKVYGCDLFCRDSKSYYDNNDGYEYYRDHFDWLCDDTDSAIKRLTEAGIANFWGVDAYSESTAKMIQTSHGELIDFVLDDAAPSDGALCGLIPAWKNYISQTGCIVSQTPFGNGTPSIVKLTREQCLEKCEILADQGMILFDMHEYATKDPNPRIENIISYLGFYSKDYSNYEELLKKYDHNIVAGRNNWKG
jgi:hypothetical protein